MGGSNVQEKRSAIYKNHVEHEDINRILAGKRHMKEIVNLMKENHQVVDLQISLHVKLLHPEETHMPVPKKLKDHFNLAFYMEIIVFSRNYFWLPCSWMSLR